MLFSSTSIFPQSISNDKIVTNDIFDRTPNDFSGNNKHFTVNNSALDIDVKGIPNS